MYKEKFREDIVEKVAEKGQHDPEYMERAMLKWKDDFSKDHGSVPLMKNIDFFVTNVEFTRIESTSSSSSSSWRIREGSKPSFPLRIVFLFCDLVSRECLKSSM